MFDIFWFELRNEKHTKEMIASHNGNLSWITISFDRALLREDHNNKTLICRPNTFTSTFTWKWSASSTITRSFFFAVFIKLNFQLIVVNKNQWFQDFLVSFTVCSFRYRYFLTTQWRTSSMFSFISIIIDEKWKFTI